MTSQFLPIFMPTALVTTHLKFNHLGMFVAICIKSFKHHYMLYKYITTSYLEYIHDQRYTYRALQTIQMKLILLCVWSERALLGSAKTASFEFKYEI